jgi:L-alanine-DL-glutamate epimerase-like enolase superfamily enzyme
MKIVDIRPVLLTAPYGGVGAQASRRSACFIEVETDEGITGIGETYAGVYVPELAASIVNWFKPFLVGSAFKARGGDFDALLQTDVGKSASADLGALFHGLDARNPEQIYRLGYWLSSYVGRTGPTVMVLSAIENAIWDILGKSLGVPVHVLLGGAVHNRLPMYASGGVPTFSIDQLVEQASAVRAAGFLGFKMRANFFAYQPEVEAERIGAVREVIGPNIALALDAVQSFNFHPWSVKQVVRMLERLAPFNLAWAEEMLPPFDPAPYAELRRATSTPISGGEGITTASQFEQWVRAGAFDLAQPDATIIGGIGEARRACENARAHDVPVAVHVWGSAPTLMANYNLAFTQPNCIWLERPVMQNPLEEELLVKPLQIQNGYLLPPTAPGLGVKLTPEIKAKYPYVAGSASMFG